MVTSFRFASTVALVFALGIADVHAQTGPRFDRGRPTTHAGDRGRTLTGPSSSTAAAIVAQFLRARGKTIDPNTLEVSQQATAQNGIRVIRFEQRAGALRLYGAYARASLTARGELVHLIDNLSTNTAAALPPLRVNEAAALAAALNHLYPGQAITVGPGQSNGDRMSFARTAFFHDEPTVTRVAYVGAGGVIGAGLLVETWSEEGNRLNETLVGSSGEILSNQLRTSEDRYNVFRVSPLVSPQTVVDVPGAGNPASPAGWLSGAQSSTHIAGNNANAYLDADANNRADRGGTAVANGEFLTAWNGTSEPSAGGNRDVAVQNLFYLNNVIHDILYVAGFTESAGNFQEDNFGQGGAGSDSVNAEAQDGAGTDNANFATPPDGRNPRMQMFLWHGDGAYAEVVVNAPASIAGSYGAAAAEFGKPPTAAGVTGDVTLVNDGTDPASDGCEPLQSFMKGHIALIDRGGCNFTVKVLNAQNAGARAVIVANNAGTTEIFTMGGSDRRIRIPAVMISRNDGIALKDAAAVNATVRAHANPPLMIDASLDSDVVYHEYGHGLTWRMIGDMSGPLAGAVGEGASDTLAFLINGDDVIGEYSSSNLSGIRRSPYTNYPRTYANVTGASVHDDGEIFAAAMWRLKELFEQNASSASQLLEYFVDSMFFIPSRPAFEDMRDGLLQSAAPNPVNQCLIWRAFSQYGIGEGASGTETADGVAVVQSFAMPAHCP